VEPLKLYLTKYRESIKGDKSLGEDTMQEEAIQISPQQMVQLAEGSQHVLIQGDGNIMQQADGQFIFKSE